MCCPVAELQKRMSSAEFGEWLAYDQIDPGQPERSDIQTALVASVIANTHRSKKTKPYAVSDFILKFKSKKIFRETQENIKMKLQSFLAAFKGKIHKKEK